MTPSSSAQEQLSKLVHHGGESWEGECLGRRPRAPPGVVLPFEMVPDVNVGQVAGDRVWSRVN